MKHLRDSLKKLLDRQLTDPLTLPSHLVVYGAGKCGRAVAALASRRGIRVEAFLDANSQLSGTVNGIPCHLPQSAEARQFAAAGVPVAIAIFNYSTSILPIISLLRSTGFEQILSYYEIHEKLGAKPDFWLTGRAFLQNRKQEILKGFDLFGDDESRKVYHDQIALRLTFDSSLLQQPETCNQYIPLDLPRPKSPMRLIDGGAFTGDTIKFFLERDFKIEALAAFEPDLVNFRSLKDIAEKKLDLSSEVLLLPCGLGKSTGLRRFSSGEGTGSSLSQDGAEQILVVALDDVAPNFSPTMIKLDIEGAELEALEGASGIIRRYQPSLAICVYHSPEHLWEIPTLIRQLLPNHQLALRYHQLNGFETVAYAFQE